MIRVLPAAFCAAVVCLSGCGIERPDPASQAAAILHKHPSDFQDQLVSLDGLALREVEALEPSALPAARPILAESVYAYSKRLRPRVASAADDSERIAALNAFFFDSLGIVPLDADTTLAASVPSLALAKRRGSCVALVLLYLAVGRSLDLPLVPVFLPGHVAVRLSRDAGRINIETLRRGIARSDSFYRETFSLGKRPWYSLADGRADQALAALLFNLANARRAHGEPATAAQEYPLVLEALPDFPEALGNLGVCALAQGDKDRAADCFRKAFAGDSLSPAAANLRALGFSAR